MSEQTAGATPAGQQEAQDPIQPVEIDGSVGLGIDIVQIERMERILKRSPAFRTRVFTEAERAYCDKLAHPAVHYATRFAAKEAVLKALGTGFSRGIAPADVEVRRSAKGRPQVVLHRRASEVAKEAGVLEMHISLSSTHAEAVACAMAVTQDSVQVTEERTDPMEELTRQFKDMRSMLDDLPVAGIDDASGGSGDAAFAAEDARAGAPAQTNEGE